MKKVENRLVIESEFYFFIYDFTTNRLQKYNTEYGHLGWQIFEKTIYFIENTHSRQTRLMAYDIVSGTVNKIDTGEYMPVQFRVRQDGAIGMWGENAKGEKEYCFWESMENCNGILIQVKRWNLKDIVFREMIFGVYGN